MRSLRVLAFVAAAVVVCPGLARADAASDVRLVKSGKLPVVHEWLGWDTAGVAHFRTLVCSEGGTVTCRAELVRARADAPKQSTTMLDVNEVYCGPGQPCLAMDRTTVSKFVAAEASAVAALPPNRALTAAETDPVHMFGDVLGSETRVEIRTLDASKVDRTNVIVRLVLRGADGSVETLGNVEENVYRLNASRIVAAHKSPNAESAAFVVETDVGVMCWDFQGLGIVAVNIARKRASLANTMGFRAWKKQDMVFAKRAFTEATVTDPTFGLGWYNRASVESRLGDVPAARASLARAVAIDASFASRGCADTDFAALRSAEPALFACPKSR